jgi:hypothetical protein
MMAHVGNAAKRARRASRGCLRRGSGVRRAVDKSPIGEGLQWVRGRFAAIVVGGALRARALSRNGAVTGGMARGALNRWGLQ